MGEMISKFLFGRGARRAATFTVLLPVLGVAVTLAGCSTYNSLTQRIAQRITPYRITIVQGNFVSQEAASKLRLGMSEADVRGALGTPLLTDMFHTGRWDYVFYFKRGSTDIVQERDLTVNFVDGRLASWTGANDLPSNYELISEIDGDKKATTARAQERQRAAAAAAAAASAPSAPAPALVGQGGAAGSFTAPPVAGAPPVPGAPANPATPANTAAARAANQATSAPLPAVDSRAAGAARGAVPSATVPGLSTNSGVFPAVVEGSRSYLGRGGAGYPDAVQHCVPVDESANEWRLPTGACGREGEGVWQAAGADEDGVLPEGRRGGKRGGWTGGRCGAEVVSRGGRFRCATGVWRCRR